MGAEYKTEIHKDIGKYPVWNHTFEVPITVADNELEFTVKDDDVLTSDIIGSVEINPHALCVNNDVKDWFVIRYKGEEAGRLELETKFTPNVEPN